jgi:hypothetical protein
MCLRKIRFRRSPRNETGAIMAYTQTMKSGAPEKIEVTISYNSKDFWRFYVAHYFEFSTFLIIATSFALFGIFLSVFILGEFFVGQIVTIAALSFACALIFGLMMSYWSVRTAVSKSSERCRYDFYQDQVIISIEGCRSNIEWAYFETIKENRKEFVLQAKDGYRHLLPKRCFTNEHQIVQLRQILGSNSNNIPTELLDNSPKSEND